ncbi:hypothetical protein [Luteimonas salinilitoris]|uniref:Uncharacterized protein n=1 Tax=Luteimonas salinilitoris TaxID=3237697 RepID=A0ABV4HTK0_9GAMM
MTYCVGLLLDQGLVVLGDTDSIDGVVEQRMDEGDEYFAMIRERWSKALSEAHQRIPAPDWLSP